MATKNKLIPDWAILPGIAAVGLGIWQFSSGKGSNPLAWLTDGTTNTDDTRFHRIVQYPKLRDDKQGDGRFGSSRGSRKHNGLDLVVTPGETIFSPIAGKVIRHTMPYDNDSRYSGLHIQDENYLIKIFYMLPSVKPGQYVTRGQAIGTAQKISTKYGGGMIDHVHVEVWPGGVEPAVDPGPFFGV